MLIMGLKTSKLSGVRFFIAYAFEVLVTGKIIMLRAIYSMDGLLSSPSNNTQGFQG